MPKFFVAAETVYENEIHITGDTVNHIKNVLRLGINDEITINDRQGNDYKCIIKEVGNSCVIGTIKERYAASTEPQVEVVLFQSLIKGEKLEWVIQKSVEIGVTKIIPIETSRCIVKLESKKKTDAKVERWNKIAEAAAKQSGRGIVPKVMEPLAFKEALAYANKYLDTACIPYEKEKEQSIKTFLQHTNATHIGVFIGPEGGFTEEEVRMAMETSVISVTLGSRILRSETAGLVVLANIMYEMGEME